MSTHHPPQHTTHKQACNEVHFVCRGALQDSSQDWPSFTGAGPEVTTLLSVPPHPTDGVLKTTEPNPTLIPHLPGRGVAGGTIGGGAKPKGLRELS